MGIGNQGGCGKDFMYNFVNVMHGHAQFSEALYRSIMDTCGTGPLRNGTWAKNMKCAALVNEMNGQIGGFYIYDIYDTICCFFCCCCICVLRDFQMRKLMISLPFLFFVLFKFVFVLFFIQNVKSVVDLWTFRWGKT